MKSKKKLNVLITAGPTREFLDPVRYLSNRSTGKMGYALASAAAKAGFNVVLVSGPVALAKPKGCIVIPVLTALEMNQVVQKHFPDSDITIKTAAVADYRPKRRAGRKIKKSRDPMTVAFVRNPDILKRLGKRKSSRQTLIGFAAETHDLEHYAKKKLIEKNLDAIVLNDVSRSDIGFESDRNAVSVIGRNGEKTDFSRRAKDVLAGQLIRLIAEIHRQKTA